MRHHLRLQDVLPLGSIRQTWRAPGGTIFKPRRVKVLKPFTSADHYTLQFIRRHVIRRHDGLEGYPHPYSLNKVLVFNCLETWRALKPSRQTASPQNPLWKVLRQGFQRHAGLWCASIPLLLSPCSIVRQGGEIICKIAAMNSPGSRRIFLSLYGRAFFAFHEPRSVIGHIGHIGCLRRWMQKLTA